jgi:hypothetical protein
MDRLHPAARALIWFWCLLLVVTATGLGALQILGAPPGLPQGMPGREAGIVSAEEGVAPAALPALTAAPAMALSVPLASAPAEPSPVAPMQEVAAPAAPPAPEVPPPDQLAAMPVPTPVVVPEEAPPPAARPAPRPIPLAPPAASLARTQAPQPAVTARPARGKAQPGKRSWRKRGQEEARGGDRIADRGSGPDEFRPPDQAALTTASANTSLPAPAGSDVYTPNGYDSFAGDWPAPGTQSTSRAP